jgi:hypothetical protein
VLYPFFNFSSFFEPIFAIEVTPTESKTEVQRCGCCRGLIRHISALHFGFDFDAHVATSALQQEVGEATWRSSRRPGGCCAQNDVADGGVEMGLFVSRKKSAQQGH